MSEVRKWLDTIGLAQYADAFETNDLDADLLGQVDDQLLKDIGVSSAGHRLRIRNAITKLRGHFQSGTADGPLMSAGAASAERRQVTVMFSDLVGSTALSARMDPEDLREVISAYQQCVAETVQRFGGFVAKYMGDGVLIYFGYPRAHEDDAERAVRAGLELVAAIGALKTHTPLQTRVGIATGLVVVGDLIGSGEAQERGIVGETPNLAARLQGVVAEPNSFVIAESTRKLVGNMFELEDLGEQDLKGIAGPVRVWAALRPSSVESRFDALRAGGLTELVGRDEELELLLRRWSKANGSEGQVVLLSGEPGIGKSRLTAALMERLGDEPHTRLRYFCSPQHTDSALHPIVRQMERAAGFTHEDTPQQRLDKLDALLIQTFNSRQHAGLFAEMLSLPNDGRYPKHELTPQQRRPQTLDALTAQFAALSRSNPVLMIFEDAHWTDPTSLKVLGRTVDRLRELAVLLIVTYRPEFDPPWIGRPYVTALNLNRLGEREIVAIIEQVTGNKSPPESTRQDIVERTDGIPLFIEEMTKAILEAQNEGPAETILTTIPSPSIGVPASLHASLTAKLDRLGPAKEVAQIGAAIGREFSHPLLAAVARKPQLDLDEALDRLTQAGLLFQQGMPPDASYLFKHALVQDAAYGTLLREPRRALHARIAGILESQFAETTDNQPEILARHCADAGLTEKATKLWAKAGQRSLERSALEEASEQLKRALDLIETLPPTPETRREQIKLQVALITPLIHVRGYSAPETKSAVEQSRLLIEQAEARGEAPEDPLLFLSALYGAWAANFVAFDGKNCRSVATQLLSIADKRKIEVSTLIGHRVMGHTLVLMGEFSQALRHYEKALLLYKPAEHQQLAMRFGQDIMTTVLSYRCLALWSLGYPESGLKNAKQAVEIARETGQAASLMFALFMISIFHIACGNYSLANDLARELFTLAKDKGALL
jgi:class 3 adenylate cyclase/tetratricopeptide (TPR) repeat protein